MASNTPVAPIIPRNLASTVKVPPAGNDKALANMVTNVKRRLSGINARLANRTLSNSQRAALSAEQARLTARLSDLQNKSVQQLQAAQQTDVTQLNETRGMFGLPIGTQPAAPTPPATPQQPTTPPPNQQVAPAPGAVTPSPNNFGIFGPNFNLGFGQGFNIGVQQGQQIQQQNGFENLNRLFGQINFPSGLNNPFRGQLTNIFRQQPAPPPQPTTPNNSGLGGFFATLNDPNNIGNLNRSANGFVNSISGINLLPSTNIQSVARHFPQFFMGFEGLI